MKTNILKKLAATTSALALLMAFAPVQSAHAAYPGLNGRVFYATTQDGNSEIYSMNSQGGGKRNITNNAASESRPDLSKDGTKMTFTSNRSGNNEVYISDHLGGNPTNITNDSANDADSAISPDGSRIVFRSNRSGNPEIYVASIDGTSALNVSNHAADDEDPTWSPDGTKIFFRSARDSNAEIYSVSPNGTGLTNITNTAANEVNPNVSPDGSRIVYAKAVGGTSSSFYEIFVASIDGSNPVQVTSNSLQDTQPTWSPDGTKILYERTVSSNGSLYLANPDGTDETLLHVNVGGALAAGQPLTISPNTISTDLALDATKGSATYHAPANHTDAYEEIDPTSVEITSQPQHGTVAVDEPSGEITYTPNQHARTGQSFLASLDSLFFHPASAQSANQDSFSYRICSTANSQLCTTNTVQVNLAAAATGPLASTGASSHALAMYAWMLVALGLVVSIVRKRLRS